MSYHLSNNLARLIEEKVTDPNDSRRAKGGKWVYDKFPEFADYDSPFIACISLPTSTTPRSLNSDSGVVYEDRALIDIAVMCNRNFAEGSRDSELDAYGVIARLSDLVRDTLRDSQSEVRGWDGCWAKGRIMSQRPQREGDLVGWVITYRFVNHFRG